MLPGIQCFKQVVALGQLSSTRHGPFLATAGSYKTALIPLVFEISCTTRAARRRWAAVTFERDDVNALPNAMDVAGIGGVSKWR